MPLRPRRARHESVWQHSDGRCCRASCAASELRHPRSSGMDWPLQGLDDGRPAAARRPPGVRRVGGARRRRGRPDRGRGLARRRVDPDARDARRARRTTARCGSPTPSRASRRTSAGRAHRLGAIDFLAVPLEEVRENFARFGCEQGVEFVPGFFEETLPGLAGRRWSIVRLDGDTYEATLTGAASRSTRASAPGGYLIVDDYGALEECRRAVDEFRERARDRRSRSSRSTGPACAGGAARDAAIEPAAAARAAAEPAARRAPAPGAPSHDPTSARCARAAARGEIDRCASGSPPPRRRSALRPSAPAQAAARAGPRVIAFGSSITEPDDVRSAARSRGIRLAASRTRRYRRTPAAGSIFRSYNLIARHASPSATTSRRSCSSTRTPRSSTPTSAPSCARRCATPTSASSAASARSGSAASPGGRAR